MRELRRGLWHWNARHPQWEDSEPWDPNVSSYALDDGERLIFFDPLEPPAELLELAAQREPVIVLTAPWHERSAESLVERLGAPVYTAAPDSAQYLIDTFGITAEQAGQGSPDVVWLLREGKGEAHVFEAGDTLPFGIQVFPGHKHNDLVLWIERVGALVVGDTLADFGKGIAINERWLIKMTRDELRERLLPLLDLPVEHVLPAHGQPGDRSTLEGALA